MTEIKVELGERSYPVYIGRALIADVGKYFNLSRRVFVLTDSGVPAAYAEAVATAAKEAKIHTVNEGEGAKSPEVLTEVLSAMLEFNMTRGDCLVAVGGGVVGDLGGFAAACYMRGIDFYNVPTTLLSEIDSSVGGKTAINLGGVKNVVGAFHQPKAVLIDPDTLKSLPKRHISNGMAEAIKMAMTSDSELFGILEKEELDERLIDTVIERSVRTKARIVELDEREGGIRKILNFGHTFGHAIESAENMGNMLHGECVAMGCCIAVSDEIRRRVIPVFEKFNLPVMYEGDLKAALSYTEHDKKSDGKYLSVIFVEKIGETKILKMSKAGFFSMSSRSTAKIKKIKQL